MSLSNNAPRTRQANCDIHLYYISTKRGWQRYAPPGGDVPFAVEVRGKWHLVYRAVNDAEWFAAHPGATFRVTVRPLNPVDPWIFRVKITTRDGGAVHDGCDSADVCGALNHVGGESRHGRFKAAVRRMLHNPNLVIAA